MLVGLTPKRATLKWMISTSQNDQGISLIGIRREIVQALRDRFHILSLGELPKERGAEAPLLIS